MRVSLVAKSMRRVVPIVGIRAYKLGKGMLLSKKNIENITNPKPIMLNDWFNK